MNTKDREFLRTHRKDICLVDFDAASVSKKLHEENVFTKNDAETVSSEEKDLRQKERLLDVLPRRGPKSFDSFIKAAKDLKIYKLYELLGGDISQINKNTDTVVCEGAVDEKCMLQESKMADCADGPPKQLPSNEEKPSEHSDTVDTPPGEVEDGRPSIFGGSSKKKIKPEDTDEPMAISPTSFLEASVDLSECYSMSSTPRGFFMLVNNKHFLPSSGMEKYPRNGTDVDAAAITSVFQEMGFITEEHHNLSVYEMRKAFKKAATRDYKGISCLCCCVLSHGQEGVVYGTDGTIDIRDITSYFHGSNLSGKPKLFFFQACQGSDYMDSVMPEETLETDGPSGEGNDITLPSEADFLFAYSTVPGYYSWRNSQRGSWFIQSICEVFRKHAHKMDVVRMLTRANNIVATKKSQTGQRQSHHKRQIASIVTQLRKELYFFPMHGPLEVYKGNY